MDERWGVVEGNASCRNVAKTDCSRHQFVTVDPWTAEHGLSQPHWGGLKPPGKGQNEGDGEREKEEGEGEVEEGAVRMEQTGCSADQSGSRSARHSCLERCDWLPLLRRLMTSSLLHWQLLLLLLFLQLHPQLIHGWYVPELHCVQLKQNPELYSNSHTVPNIRH